MIRTPYLIASLAAASLLLGACGDDDPTTTSAADQPAAEEPAPDTQSSVPPDGGGAAGSACLEGSTDCNDTGAPVNNDEGAARSLLGVAKDDLGPDVRIARIDDEQFMLTEDYVVGRLTVELDTGDDGVARVTKVTLEAEDGPVTVEA